MNTRSMQRKRRVAGITLRRTEFFRHVWMGENKHKVCSFRRVRHNGVLCWQARGPMKASPRTYFSTLHRAVEFHLGKLNA